MGRFYRHWLIGKNFPHHGAVMFGHYAKPLYDASDFITSHWLENGGFGATLIDVESDVEYVFYGLLALGAL